MSGCNYELVLVESAPVESILAALYSERCSAEQATGTMTVTSTGATVLWLAETPPWKMKRLSTSCGHTIACSHNESCAGDEATGWRDGEKAWFYNWGEGVWRDEIFTFGGETPEVVTRAIDGLKEHAAEYRAAYLDNDSDRVDELWNSEEMLAGGTVIHLDFLASHGVDEAEVRAPSEEVHFRPMPGKVEFGDRLAQAGRSEPTFGSREELQTLLQGPWSWIYVGHLQFQRVAAGVDVCRDWSYRPIGTVSLEQARELALACFDRADWRALLPEPNAAQPAASPSNGGLFDLGCLASAAFLLIVVVAIAWSLLSS